MNEGSRKEEGINEFAGVEAEIFRKIIQKQKNSIDRQYIVNMSLINTRLAD